MARRPDFSILFLKPSLAEVYDVLDDSPIANIFRRNFICLSPNEFYTQISNYDGNVNLGADAKVELVDCCDRVLLDITDKTTIRQFNHEETGKSQMVYEFRNIGQNFHKAHLKFTQITNPSNVFYSNPFEVTSDLKETTRFDYRAFGVYNGVDWATPNVMCSIRLRGYFTKPEPKTGNDNYLATTGRMMTLYPTPNIPDLFEINYQDNHGLVGFEYIRYCCPFVVYLTKHTQRYGLRASNIETASEATLGSSNFFVASYTAKLEKDDDYTPVYQITPNFMLISKDPLGVYREDEFPTEMTGTFNYPITLGTGTLTIYTSHGDVFAEFTELDIVLVGSTFTIDISALALDNGNYYISFTSGLFNSPDGQTYSIEPDNASEWAFAKLAGRFDPTRFNNSRFL